MINTIKAALGRPRVGDFVTAKLLGLEDFRQGVLVKVNGDGTLLVRGQANDYICEADAVVVPDRSIWSSEVWAFVGSVRRGLRTKRLFRRMATLLNS